ncbi:hypothetical protein J6590_066310 [Homalodisca vitripennis]|nr:hypothetical protein J6590_066310 [Homalodisca vitripennis]
MLRVDTPIWRRFREHLTGSVGYLKRRPARVIIRAQLVKVPAMFLGIAARFCSGEPGCLHVECEREYWLELTLTTFGGNKPMAIRTGFAGG